MEMISHYTSKLKKLGAILVAALFAPTVVERLAPSPGEPDAIVLVVGFLIVSIAAYGIRESRMRQRARPIHRTRGAERTPIMPNHVEEDNQ